MLAWVLHSTRTAERRTPGLVGVPRGRVRWINERGLRAQMGPGCAVGRLEYGPVREPTSALPGTSGISKPIARDPPRTP